MVSKQRKSQEGRRAKAELPALLSIVDGLVVFFLGTRRIEALCMEDF